MFDAYTVKKVLPRLFIAIILIQLSWFIFTGLVRIMNLVAYGVEGLIYAPFGGLPSLGIADILSKAGGGGTGLGFSAIVLGGGALVVGAIAVGGVLATAGIVLLGVLIAFALLLFRQVMIIGLLMIAPLALVAWILPSTEKYWKLWWDSFFKLLLVFPIILGMIAVGRVFAFIIADVDPQSGTFGAVDDIVIFLMIVAAVIAPFFLIPKTFQMAGGAFAALSGAVANKGAGASNFLKNRRKQTMAKNWKNLQDGKRFKDDGMFGRFNSSLQKGSMLTQAGLRPKKWRANMQAAISEKNSALASQVEQDEAVQVVNGNDDLLAASMHADSRGQHTEASARAYLQGIGQTGQELEQNVASIMRARRSVGSAAFQEWAAAANAGTGTGYESGFGEMAEAITQVAGGDSAKAARILNKARGFAEKARRVDLYGAGFATSADMLSQVANGQITAEQANEVVTREALRSKNPGEIAYARNNALTNMSGAIIERAAEAQYGVEVAESALATARSSGNAAAIDAATQTLEEAQHHRKRTFAQTSALLEAAGSTSEENNEIIGAIMGQQVGADGRGITVRDPSRDKYGTDADGNQVLVASGVKVASTMGQAIDAFEGDEEYKQYKKTFKNDIDAAVAAQQADAARRAGAGGGGYNPNP